MSKRVDAGFLLRWMDGVEKTWAKDCIEYREGYKVHLVMLQQSVLPES